MEKHWCLYLFFCRVIFFYKFNLFSIVNDFSFLSFSLKLDFLASLFPLLQLLSPRKSIYILLFLFSQYHINFLVPYCHSFTFLRESRHSVSAFSQLWNLTEVYVTVVLPINLNLLSFNTTVTYHWFELKRRKSVLKPSHFSFPSSFLSIFHNNWIILENKICWGSTYFSDSLILWLWD